MWSFSYRAQPWSPESSACHGPCWSGRKAFPNISRTRTWKPSWPTNSGMSAFRQSRRRHSHGGPSRFLVSSAGLVVGCAPGGRTRKSLRRTSGRTRQRASGLCRKHFEGLRILCGSPLACVSGVTGADLKKRMVHIMSHHVVRKLDFSRKLLLSRGCCACHRSTGCIRPGESNSGIGGVERRNTPAAESSFESVSIKPSAFADDNRPNHKVMRSR